jgi:hypothetical protein
VTLKLPDCKVCKEPERARLIEADWAGGMSAVGIAKRMGEAGWPIQSDTILRHLKRHVPNARNRTNDPIPKGRDAAAFIRDRQLAELERIETLERIEAENEDRAPSPVVLAKDLQPAIASMLKAQTIIDKRENQAANRKIDLFKLMLGGADGAGLLAPPRLRLEEGEIIDGEAEEVFDEEDLA